MVLTERERREKRMRMHTYPCPCTASGYLRSFVCRRRVCVCGVGVVERYCLSAHARSAQSRGEGDFDFLFVWVLLWFTMYHLQHQLGSHIAHARTSHLTTAPHRDSIPRW